MKQISDEIMVMSWKPVASSENLNYEAQVRLLSSQSQDFQQVSNNLRNQKLRKHNTIIFLHVFPKAYKDCMPPFPKDNRDQ